VRRLFVLSALVVTFALLLLYFFAQRAGFFVTFFVLYLLSLIFCATLRLFALRALVVTFFALMQRK
jgi:hypothetical protein